MTAMRTIRNLLLASLLAASGIVVAERNVSAASCDDAWMGLGVATLQYCGPYGSESEALGDMEGIAAGVCNTPNAYLYWYVRVGDFQGDLYYDSGWACSW